MRRARYSAAMSLAGARTCSGMTGGRSGKVFGLRTWVSSRDGAAAGAAEVGEAMTRSRFVVCP